ncbi:IclR family transcriptional regulator [Salibacterium halotolerans]|uniref:IclR family transcriptional regulator, KDG regulon repressor n=1 Tax=Salibacterium halotolerans TaxID=1884432 RepID=A0A1I5RTL7_9BACI|nr:IclR family transcriptional regulator [Salibacterium halotolerans]SFP61868.1 IclR family transcriptional regulator, KDG regulon repressor [Salibacterium halotolerans]
MAPKYWVPALERANIIIELIAQFPSQLRLIDISNKLEINKSSMYSLLHTLETMGWIKKDKNETYSLGPVLGSFASAYYRQFDILETFSMEAGKAVEVVDEHIQLGKLYDAEVFYLAREEGSSPARLVTDPGMRFPAHASAIGKIQLMQHTYERLHELFPEKDLLKKTENTVGHIDELWKQLQQAAEDGYVVEEQEGSLGFCCVAAPIYNQEEQLIAGVSFTMIANNWPEKKELATGEIMKLAKQLSTN